MTSQLEQLKRFTKVVADTGDFGTIKEYGPEDATTNPSLILKAAQMPDYKYIIDKAVADGGDIEQIYHRVLVLFGVEILKIIPGRISTETDAHKAFDVNALVTEARQFIALYQKQGVPRERVLIKIASTWEGVRAAEVLQKEGINCNMTLLFSLVQAVACAEVGAKLISPFVGRILDWHKKNTGKDFAPAEDPGVKSVREIYAYYKKFGHPTEVMGASFRNAGEILELAGSDLLTISPQLMAELHKNHDPVERKLTPEWARAQDVKKLKVDEPIFRFLLNEDAMATDKTSEGIRIFAADSRKLWQYLKERR